MNNDEFAFFNHQLAGMLRDGIPLEGALRKLCEEMPRGKLRTELELLEADLARGVPLKEAIRIRDLPELYQRMLLVGVKSNDLPAILILLGDYYQKRYSIWTRLKGLMVYPAIVLVSAFLISCFLCVIVESFMGPSLSFLGGTTPRVLAIVSLMPPIFLGMVVVLATIFAAVPGARRYLRWRLPAFRESNLAQVASAMSLMLKNGVPLDDALALMEQIEHGTKAGEELAHWRRAMAEGRGKFSEMAASGKVFPPLFIWMVAQSGADLGAGFTRAADIYEKRTAYRADALLYSALPCAVLALGLM
ncbi:MAG TPA: type II secretion system F family protein, partial [Verrucomicrobiae bacterium]|nr:type II secretion system F family protein [Verrucomicrobiae bacterium]